MKIRNHLSFAAFAVVMLSSCATRYTVSDITRSRILIDSRYDSNADAQAEKFIAPFRAKVDSVMSPLVGYAARPLESYQPESPLSNLLADILVWGGKPFGEKPDFAVYNMGGIRAAFAEGKVTYGDVLDVAPFENKICFLTLSGEKVLELFRQMADFGGQGVSHGVEAVMGADRQLKSLRLNGNDIDPDREYRIATLDYLAEGNDRMMAFKSKTKVNSPQGDQNNVRFIIISYFKELAAAGKAADAKVEGRFVKEQK